VGVGEGDSNCEYVSVGLQGSFSWPRTHSSALSACFQLVFSLSRLLFFYSSI
jgi:hypothetical protein